VLQTASKTNVQNGELHLRSERYIYWRACFSICK